MGATEDITIVVGRTGTATGIATDTHIVGGGIMITTRGIGSEIGTTRVGDGEGDSNAHRVCTLVLSTPLVRVNYLLYQPVHISKVVNIK
jgi:hypothetical protein